MPSVAELRRIARERGVAIDERPRAASTRGNHSASSLRPWHPYRSKWELEYAQYLDVLKATNKIWDWHYEPESLEIGVGAKYTPDFKVWITFGGRVEYREVKGYKREAAMVRLRVAAARYPNDGFVLVTKKNGQWTHVTIAPAPALARPRANGEQR